MSDGSKLGTTQFLTLFFVIMSKSLMLSMLAQGNTGDEILSILDVIVSDNVAEVVDMPILGQSVPTLEEIAF